MTGFGHRQSDNAPAIAPETAPIAAPITTPPGPPTKPIRPPVIPPPKNPQTKSEKPPPLAISSSSIVYHACLIPDATACCAQGIEFIWGGEHQWPDDYQEEGTDIIVTGRLETYDEDGYQYLHLVDSEVLWEKETNS